jgi:hypothetical protein
MGKHECFKCDFVTFIYTYNIKKISKNFIKYFIRIPNTTEKYYAFFCQPQGAVLQLTVLFSSSSTSLTSIHVRLFIHLRKTWVGLAAFNVQKMSAGKSVKIFASRKEFWKSKDDKIFKSSFTIQKLRLNTIIYIMTQSVPRSKLTLSRL